MDFLLIKILVIVAIGIMIALNGVVVDHVIRVLLGINTVLAVLALTSTVDSTAIGTAEVGGVGSRA